MHMAVLSIFISLPISVPPEHPAASPSGFSANSYSVITILRDRFLHCARRLSLSLSQTFIYHLLLSYLCPLCSFSAPDDC
ncbi:hypothetical protein B0H13DRAFT_2036448, partial [Mycena leptocephala]